MKINKKLFLFIILNFLCIIVFSQKKVEVISPVENQTFTDKKSKLPKKAKDLAILEEKLRYYVNYYKSVGYITFSVDSIAETDHKFEVYIFPGRKYGTTDITIPEEDRLLLGQTNTSGFLDQGRLPVGRYPAFASKLVNTLGNTGFPFAEVYLDSIIIEDNNIHSRLVVNKNQYIIFDSIILKGNLKLAKSYLYPYLGLRRNKAYNENAVRQVPAKIAELPFATEMRSSGIEFVADKAYLYLFLDKVRTNQFDGYIGLVPVNEETGKVTLNGELNLGLKNIFTLGESISLQWRSPGKYSQYLNINADFPYLLWTPFGINGNFILDKTDTSYVTMNYTLGLQYSFKGNNYLKIYFDQATSNILAPGLLAVSEGNFSYIDYRRTMYGVEFVLRKLDYLYNPRKGFSLLVNGSVGKMNIIRNSKAEEGFYDDVEMSTLRYRIQGLLRGYIPMHPRWVMVLGADGGALFGNQHVANEMFKFGGMRTFRGFDENSIQADAYVIGLWELRFIFARKSYINAFFNGAWYEKNLSTQYLRDTPFGFGIGIAFDTKAGMFNLSYALGKQLGNPISFKSGKIHFGIVMNF